MSKATTAVVCLLIVATVGVLPVSLHAQTAHFSGAQSPLGSGLSSPGGVAVDGSGNVYVANTNLGHVLLETLSFGTYTQSTVASGLFGAQGVAVDGSGNVYIADGGGPPSKLFVETPSSLGDGDGSSENFLILKKSFESRSRYGAGAHNYVQS